MLIFASDPRALQHQQSWGSSGPNQSKSFRVLQKITDTMKDEPLEVYDDQPAELQQPHYARPLGPADMNENQLRKLNMSESDRAFMNRVKSDGNF